ncbi:hypothetical protein KY290_014828 [Solanum tuberosum]|uniref:Uncharacterized protein n=1 Tax=Solanum tuberosum TaxID=4113 RepID=A0ABQ7VQP6_SOLTU|nr:hypothetical protein KY290_014828 [Solanum tuberosum]
MATHYQIDTFVSYRQNTSTAKAIEVETTSSQSSPEHHCQPSSAPHLIQLSYIFAPQMLVLGPGNARPAFTMDGQWRILETKVSNMDAKDTLQ